MKMLFEKQVAINFPTDGDCSRFINYLIGNNEHYSSRGVRFKISEFQQGYSYTPGDEFIGNGMVINIKNGSLQQQDPLPEIDGYTPQILFGGNSVKVGCQEVPFETVKKIYKAMVNRREE